jgi:hypothetical protein
MEFIYPGRERDGRSGFLKIVTLPYLAVKISFRSLFPSVAAESVVSQELYDTREILDS